MEITVRVEVQYNAPEHALVRDMLRMFRTPVWVRFMVRYISPHLKNCAPTNKDVVDGLTQWRKASSTAAACVICMNEAPDAIELPCGHCFHQGCIESWLKMRSTCPTCRHQLPKAFSGCYAVRTLNSALLLKDEHRSMPKHEILNCKVGKEPVRAIVNVTLGQVAGQNKQQQFPCVLNALMAFANGDVFNEADVDKLDATDADLAEPTGRQRRCEEAACASSSHAVPSRSKRARVN